ncbi:NAD(P)/FAD-dependent oxidoreductase [Cerasicoccus arenae]|uniref:Flavoprotein n=1 Tax=Cerasicoccus arenae TaxID=424488 RepID=A0A8J3GDN3_9BACT|nr:NAD(P)/FAD-dependent oxidoreductase [Cerasicoccus arenae]MBK1857424.1 NAD(P)/FAD-dependent oxidoreductase [Cerasicoccus arenae]GHC07802.1 flavoprotein [Cerasicoccus arenae]
MMSTSPQNPDEPQRKGSKKAPRLAIVGGGAAGFFTAITAAEANPKAKVTIYERGQKWLAKVKISGGGRCNVTHACFDPKELSTRYPRGSRELRAAFHRWQPQDTLDWFTERGVHIKREDDGRMFPTTDDSQTIIDCFLKAAQEAGIQRLKGVGLKSLTVESDGSFTLERTDDQIDRADAICIAAGSLKASPLMRALEGLGHTIEPLAPSLFAFNVADKRTHGLAGLSVQDVSVQVIKGGKPQVGPILITHRGFSGPAILRLSAWEARALQAENYHFEIAINWLGQATENQLREQFNQLRKRSGKNNVQSKVFDAIPRRLWERLVQIAGIAEDMRWAQLPKDQENALIRELVDGHYQVQGKTTNKDEFVTCGGVKLKEVDFRRMESRVVPHLHFAGECLDIDGITGGFNFQAAWTTGRIAGETMAVG